MKLIATGSGLIHGYVVKLYWRPELDGKGWRNCVVTCPGKRKANRFYECSWNGERFKRTNFRDMKRVHRICVVIWLQKTFSLIEF